MSAPITPDERAAMRAFAIRMTYFGEVGAADGILRLLDALDTAEAEVARLREEAAPVRPDRETIARALRDAGLVEVVAVHEGYGVEEVIHAHLRPVVDAVLDLWPGESRATVQAEALRDAAERLGPWTLASEVRQQLLDDADRLDPRGADR